MLIHTRFQCILIILLLGLSACAGSDLESEETSQFTIGLVSNNSNGLNNIAGFIDGMAELGYVAGENVTYIFDGAPVSSDNLDGVLQSMVDAKVDLIFTAGTPTGVAAHRVTTDTDIPVVFGVIADPIAAGVMDDLTVPGGNITGVMLSENQIRRMELFLQAVPSINHIFIPYNPDDPAPVSALEQIHALATTLGTSFVTAEAHNDDEVTQVLNNLPDDIDAIFLLPDTVVNARISDIIALSIEKKLPISGPSNTQVEDGALMAYGIIHREVGIQAASIADKILRGYNPGTIPVETAESYLGINLVTAEAIGIEVPYSILQRAAIIIRMEEKE